MLNNMDQNTTNVDRQVEKDTVHGVVDIKEETADESVLVGSNGALLKQEPLDRDCAETCDNVYDSYFEVAKQEWCGDSSAVEHSSDTPATITDVCHESVGTTRTYVKPESTLGGTSASTVCAQVFERPLRGIVAGATSKANHFKIENQAMTSTDTSYLVVPKEEMIDKEEYKFFVIPKVEISDSSECQQGTIKSEDGNTPYWDVDIGTIEPAGTHIKEEPGAGTSWPADGARPVDACSAPECTTIGDVSMEQASSAINQSCDPARDPLNGATDTDTRARGGSSAPPGDTQARTLNRLVTTHTGAKPFACEHCEYKSFNSRNLKCHIMSHTGEKPYSCKLCEYKSTRADRLRTHMMSHTGEKPFSCEYCGHKCSHSGILKIHMRSHTGEKPYSCNFCDYKCSRSGDLKPHMWSHTGEKPYPCEYCDHKFSHPRDLKLHMRSHTGEKPFSCKLCDHKCSRSCDLKSHMRSHTGEKPYTCKICGSKYKYSNSLTIHMRSHTGEKPYTCKSCDYKCSNSTSLKLHMRSHTGENPYSCEYCDYKCLRSAGLKNHMKSHTG